ncbi:MAG: hypothetical protein ACYCZN_10840 [Candidatus Dormibacteria bacterium]
MREDPDGGPGQQIRWRWVIGCAVVGVLLWVGAYYTQARYGWTGVVPELMIDLGTACGLAGFLFILEQRFTTTVAAVTNKLVDAVETRFEAKTQQLATRLTQLGDEFRSGLASRDAQQDAKIAALEDDVSFDSVTEAIEVANDIGALAEGYPTVQASGSPDGLALEFKWLMPSAGQPHLSVIARIEADFDAWGPHPIIEVEWAPAQSASEIGVALATRLRQRDRWKGDSTLDWQLAVGNLQRTLLVAVKAQRHDADAWALHGPLFELVDDRWAITDAGVECPEKGYLLVEADFPGPVARHGSAAADWQPTKPTWTSPEEWERVLRRAKRVFPRDRGPVRFAPHYRPMTTALRKALATTES